jgi:hypothetical protein
MHSAGTHHQPRCGKREFVAKADRAEGSRRSGAVVRVRKNNRA